jgi:hypothetical protein
MSENKEAEKGPAMAPQIEKEEDKQNVDASAGADEGGMQEEK